MSTTIRASRARHTGVQKTPRKRRARAVGSELRVLNRLANELLGVCADTLRRFDVKLDRRPAAVAPLVRARYARQLIEDAGRVAMLHTRWQLESQYLDEDGNPKAIAATGAAPSFEALCRDSGVQGDADRLLELACQFGLCTRAARNRLTYGSDVFLFTGQRTLMLARAVVTVERFLATCVHNAEPGRKKNDSLGDRTTEISLSAEEFGRMSKRIRRSLSNFIESTDRELLAGATPPARPSEHRRPRKMCGVTAFAFRD